MTTYKVTLADGQTFAMSADMAEAGAPIEANFHDLSRADDWQLTPYQTADARHCEFRAAELVASYFAAGDDDCTNVVAVKVVEE